MVDLASISSAYTGLKFIKDSLEVFHGYKVENLSQDQINKALKEVGVVQDTLFHIREELFRLQTENEQLRQQLNAQEEWEKQKSQYQLKKTEGGAVVYVFTQTSDGTPEYYACPSCYTQKTIQILQDKRDMSGTFVCPSCKAPYLIEPFKSAAPPLPRNYGRLLGSACLVV